jgi:uncharacterized protein DUF2380
MNRRSLLLAGAGFVLCAGSVLGAEPPAIAVFDFELFETSGGATSAEDGRLAMISAYLRQKLADSGRYRVIDVSAEGRKIEEHSWLRACNGCELDVARKVGADLVLTGLVQKVSELILNMNIYIKDARTGAMVLFDGVDIRGNTDQSWTRAIDYMLKEQILKAK